MAMQESLATTIITTACRIIGGRELGSLDDVLSNLGITSDDQLGLLIQWIVQAAAQAGFSVNTSTLADITQRTTVRQLRNIVAQAELSPPKTCSYGHALAAGATTCAYGHPAS